MHVDALRLLDRLIGVPVCWALTVMRGTARLLRRSEALPTPRRILIIKLSEMGSTVLAYPALAELKKNSPTAELFFLVFKNNSAIVGALNLVPSKNVIGIDNKSPVRLVMSGLRALWAALSAGIDTTIDMDFYSRLTAIFSFIACRGNRVGFHRYNDEGLYRGNLLTHRVLYSPHVHTSVAFMALVKSLYGRRQDEPLFRGPIDFTSLVPPRYSPPENDVTTVREKLTVAGVPDKNAGVILINPNSSDIFPLRKWPLENFAQLCERLLCAVPQAWLVITGIESERKDARYIMETVKSPRCVDFTGKTNFRELLALYSLAQLMVTNDSGPAHFATLLSLPTIVLFGPETPRLYGPLGGNHKSLYTHFPCSPCVSVYNGKKSSCQDNRCLKSIAVEQVVDETLAWLARQSRRQNTAPSSPAVSADAE